MLTELEKLKLYTGNYTIEELSEIIKKGVLFSNYLCSSKKIINDISILDTNKYRELINCLEQNNLEFVDKIEKERNKYVENQIKLINKDGIFNYLCSNDIKSLVPKSILNQIEFNLKYNDYSSINRILKNYTEKCLFEFIIDLYFKDITYNFISNLKTMMKYINSVNEDLIPKERFIFYNQILNFHNLSIEEQKNIYYNFNPNNNYSLYFYEDFSNCKQHSYNKINESIINKENLNKYYNSNLSTKNKTTIYELNGDDFYLFVHACKLKKENNKLFPFEKNSNKTISLSLIGKDNIGVYKPFFENILLGFEKINPRNIIHLFNSDSYTMSYNGSKKIQKIYTPRDFLYETYGYNEILYSQKNNECIYPSYIVCFDEIRDIDLYFSKLIKLPIIKINTLKYRKNSIIEDCLEKRYKSSEELENVISYKVM